MDGLLLIDKPAGITSFDVVRQVRRLARTRRVGHTGTLDPDATGLLPIVLGHCTKLAKFLVFDQKEYVFEVCFGSETDTDDSTGEVIQTGDWKHIGQEALEAALEQFRGPILQVPPIYSALKIDGKRAYDLARQGKDVVLEARPVEIYGLELLEFSAPHARLRVQCSAGTYVRSLARDLGRALGSYAHTTSIRRTEIGELNIEQAHALDAIDPDKFADYLIAPLEMLRSVPGYEASDAERRAIEYGQRIEIEAGDDLSALVVGDTIILRTREQELLAVTEVEELLEAGRLRIRPRRVFQNESSK